MMQQPAARLLAVVAAVIVLIVVLALVVRDCRRGQLVDSYSSYVEDGVTPIATKSSDEGKALLSLLTNPKGENAEALQKNVAAIGREAKGLVTQAEDLNPPDKLGDAHRSLVLALQYRALGITRLSEEIVNATKSKDVTDAAARLAEPMGRVLAGDYIYADSFVGPARKALDDDDIDGVAVPDSAVLLGTSHANKAGPAGARIVLAALKRKTAATPSNDGNTDGQLRGTSLVSVKVIPAGKALVNGSVNEVTSSVDNKWEVAIKNGGDAVETGIEITTTLTSSEGAPQINKGTVETIDPDETVSIPIEMGTPPTFGENAKLVVSVAPVDGETLTSNNSASYTVKFSL